MRNRLMLASLSIIAIALLAAPSRQVVAQGEPKRIEITAKRFSFEPFEITLKKGEPVVLVVKSVDVSHGLRFRELGVDLSVHGKATAEAHFTPQKSGDFVGHCSVFCGSGHGTMALKLHVVD